MADMGFFAEFVAWLNAILEDYISNNTAAIAAALEPTIVTLATLYVVVWGYLHVMGRIEEPFVTGVKRLFVLAVILGVCLSLWYYNEIIVETFFSAPSALAAHVIGNHGSVSVWTRYSLQTTTLPQRLLPGRVSCLKRYRCTSQGLRGDSSHRYGCVYDVSYGSLTDRALCSIGSRTILHCAGFI
jgi:hypothetical protein